MKAAGVPVAQVHLRMGKADEEIVVLAEELGADLVAMGSRGLGSERKALVGSVSDSTNNRTDDGGPSWGSRP